MSQPSPTLLLDRDFVVRAATRSYLTTTGRAEDELLSVNVFDAFPQSEATAQVGSTRDFVESVEWALRTKRPHQMTSVRYDVLDPTHPGGFQERRWALVNTPIQVEERVVGVTVRVEDVTPASGRSPQTAAELLALVDRCSRLAEEVDGLRRALRSRATIEQAKGIVMRDRRCDPDAAFDVLRHLSMDANVPLADVAAAVVYQLRSPSGP